MNADEPLEIGKKMQKKVEIFTPENGVRRGKSVFLAHFLCCKIYKTATGIKRF